MPVVHKNQKRRYVARVSCLVPDSDPEPLLQLIIWIADIRYCKMELRASAGWACESPEPAYLVDLEVGKVDLEGRGMTR